VGIATAKGEGHVKDRGCFRVASLAHGRVSTILGSLECTRWGSRAHDGKGCRRPHPTALKFTSVAARGRESDRLAWMLRRGREDPECCFGSMMIEHTEKGVGEDFWDGKIAGHDAAFIAQSSLGIRNTPHHK
jgi:hypothetical protein